MRKLILFSVFFMIVFNLIGNEKIINLKHKKKFPSRLFYLEDENGNRDLGYYEFNVFTRDVDDFTVAPFKGMVNLDLIKKYGISYDLWRWSLPWSCVGLTAGGLFLGVFAGILADSFNSSKSDFYSPLDSTRGLCIAGVTLSGVLIILGVILGALFIYGVVDCIKLKKKILGILNNGGVSLSKNKSFRFVFAFDVKNNSFNR